MLTEYFYTERDFVNRLVFLCSQKGIKYKDIKNLPRALAEELVDSEIIPPIGTRKNRVENARQKITRDIENEFPVKAEFLDWYCRYFGCSADFLMGYIDTPTHEEKSVQDLTGLSDTSCSALIYKHTDVIAALNDLLSGIEDSDNEKKVDSISSIKRRLLRRIHRYFYPEKINDPNAFLELRHPDSDIFMTSYLKGFAPESISAVQMLGIQEELQRIRDNIQNKK